MCLTTVALGLLAVPTIVWLVTYFGERRLLVLDCVFFGDAICLPLFWALGTCDQPEAITLTRVGRKATQQLPLRRATGTGSTDVCLPQC